MNLSSSGNNNHREVSDMDSQPNELKGLSELKRVLEGKVSLLRRTLAKAEEQLTAVNTTLSLLHSGSETLVMDHSVGVDPLELHGMTQIKALIAIAKKNEGRIRIKDVRNTLMRAGVMKQTKNWYNILYGAINRSEAFERSGPGEYKLISGSPSTKPATED